jgi:hypothetical protein
MMGRRLGLILGVVLFGGVAVAQEAPKASPVKEPSPGEKCLADLPQWQTYATNLKLSRDQLEQDVATLRVQLAAAQAALAKATPKP